MLEEPAINIELEKEFRIASRFMRVLLLLELFSICAIVFGAPLFHFLESTFEIDAKFFKISGKNLSLAFAGLLTITFLFTLRWYMKLVPVVSKTRWHYRDNHPDVKSVEKEMKEGTSFSLEPEHPWNVLYDWSMEPESKRFWYTLANGIILLCLWALIFFF